MVEHNMENNEQYGPPPMDIFISALEALVLGGTVWALGVAAVAGINYAGQTFGIYPPTNSLLNSAIQAGYVAGPILVGFLVAVFSYRFLVNLD